MSVDSAPLSADNKMNNAGSGSDVWISTFPYSLDQQDLRHSIVTTLLTPEYPNTVDIFSSQEITLGEEPMLYKQVLDQDGKAIRWEWRAKRYADYLLANRASTRVTGRGGQVYKALTKQHTSSESRRYLEKVIKAERDFYKGKI